MNIALGLGEVRKEYWGRSLFLVKLKANGLRREWEIRSFGDVLKDRI